jgi:hypothetical protein
LIIHLPMAGASRKLATVKPWKVSTAAISNAS